MLRGEAARAGLPTYPHESLVCAAMVMTIDSSEQSTLEASRLAHVPTTRRRKMARFTPALAAVLVTTFLFGKTIGPGGIGLGPNTHSSSGAVNPFEPRTNNWW